MANQWKPPTCDCSVEGWHAECVYHNYDALKRVKEIDAELRARHVAMPYLVDPALFAPGVGRDW